MKLFNLDLHISVIEDIKNILTNLGQELISKSISSHNWVFNREPSKMDIITEGETITKKSEKNEGLFIIIISDFYYEDSAQKLKNELSKKTNINNFDIKKINNKKYRLFAGPFKTFNTLKTSYISLNNLGFENLDIYRD